MLLPASEDFTARPVIAAEDVSFMICVEGNTLGSQALLLCESLRRFGGAYADCPVWAISPRPDNPITDAVAGGLQALDVTVISEPLNTTGSKYGTINRIMAGAWAEKRMTSPYICVLDTDMIFLRPPTFFHADAGVRPVDLKGMASSGRDDANDAHWVKICAIAGISPAELPMLATSCCGSVIRASYNGGFYIGKRSLGILEETRRIFLEAFQRDLRPSPDAQDVYSSVGKVGAESASWWGSSQSALSVAISAKAKDIFLYGPSINIPLHLFAKEGVFPFHPKNSILVHYHYLAAEKHRQSFLKTLELLDCPVETLHWVATRSAQLEWDVG